MKVIKTKNVELLEMARVGFFDKDTLEIYVRTDDSGKLPHFHIWDSSTQGDKFHTCIRIDAPEYFLHTGKTDKLNSKQLKSLIKFLTDKPKKLSKYDTNWEVIIDMWNLNNSDVYVPSDTLMPDYTQLK